MTSHIVGCDWGGNESEAVGRLSPPLAGDNASFVPIDSVLLLRPKSFVMNPPLFFEGLAMRMSEGRWFRLGNAT